MTQVTSARPRRRRPPTWALVVGVLVLSWLVGLGVGLADAMDEPTSATVEVVLDPVDVGSLFEPPGTQHDPEVDLLVAARAANAAPEVDGAAEAAAGTGVRTRVVAGDPDRSTIVFVADAGDADRSEDAALAAAEAYLALRATNGIGSAEGGIAAVEQNLAGLEAGLGAITDVDQRLLQQQVIEDQQASLAQLQEGRRRLAEQPNGYPDAPVADRDLSAFHGTGLTVFALVAVTGLVLVWAWLRWTGPVTQRRGVVGSRLGVVLVDDDEAVEAYGRRIAVSGGRPGAATVVVAPAAGDDGPAAEQVAAAIASLLARHEAVALLDATAEDPDDGRPRLLSPGAEEQEVSGWVVPAGRPLLVAAGDAGPAHEAAVATPRTRRALDALRAVVRVVVVQAPAARTHVTAAWGVHADVVALVVEEGRTLQGEVRAASAALERTSTGSVEVVLVPAGGLAEPAAAVEVG